MKIVLPLTISDEHLLSSNLSETEYAEWDSTRSYTYSASVTERVRYTQSGLHRIYQLNANSGVGESPLTSANWTYVSVTNKWKMFDQQGGGQSEGYGSIDVTIAPLNPFDTLALINCSAASAVITMTDAVDGVIYNSGTVSLMDSSAITDWWAYFFEPISRKPDVIFTGLPMYRNATTRVQLSADAEVALGELLVGRTRDVGYTQYGARVGIIDYSIKSTNAWGDFTITERAFSKRGEFTVYVEPNKIDGLQSLLAQYRTTPVLYVGSDDFASTYVYGFYKDFDVTIAMPGYSICTITVEGLSQ